MHDLAHKNEILIVVNFHGECAIFASYDLSKVNIYYLHTEMVKIMHKIAHKCANPHIKIFTDKITG